jgi:hypothetical protein
MSYRLLLTSLLTTTLATVAIGCVDLTQSDGCTSDDQCRFDRICSEQTGQCVNPETTPTTIDDRDTDVPDTPPRPDVEPEPDIFPQPDGDPWGHDVPGEPDIGVPDTETPDTDTPDAETCHVVARARAMIQGSNQWQQHISTNTLETVRFDMSQSEGDISSFGWTVIERPQGATRMLLPSAGSPSPRLFIGLMGTYRIELKAFGETASGEVCMDTDVVTVQAVPADDLFIQLTWDTPNDPDQTDSHGADLDLHYLHPNGRFGQPPWDIFWPNPTSDWGVEGDSTDDPNLDIDDTDGAGPENISHNGLELVDYEIGVYLTNHEDFGPSFATVRVFHNGQLVLERENRRMEDLGAFWHVTKINGSGVVDPIDELLDGYPFL